MGKQKIACLALAAAMLSACGQAGGFGRWAADEDGIYVTKSLDVRSVMVFTSAVANDLYDQEELAQDTGEWVQDYNTKEDSEGEDDRAKLPVTLTSCTLEGGTGKMIFDYATPEDFVKFAQETGDTSHTVSALSVGTVADLLAGGKADGIQFAAPDGKPVESREVVKHSKYRVVAVEGAVTLCTEGKVDYVSSEGVTVRDDYTVITGEGLHYIVFH